MELFVLGVSIYIFLVFVGIRLLVPYYGFTTPSVDDEIPTFLLDEIKKIQQSPQSKKVFLANLFQLVTTKYRGGRWETLVYWNRAFEPIGNRKSGFIPCNIYNQLLRTMLVKSDEFSNEDIQTIVVPLNFFIHQYLKVRIDDHWIDIDPTYYNLGVPYGKHAAWFA